MDYEHTNTKHIKLLNIKKNKNTKKINYNIFKKLILLNT